MRKGTVLTVILLFLLLVPSVAADEKAPLLTLPPRGEQLRRFELHGDVMMARKRYREAVDFYQQALHLDPKNASLANKLGISYFQLQNYSRASAWYSRALKVNPDHFEARNNLGMVYYARRNYKKARRDFERALQLRPESASARINLGAALVGLKKHEEAVQQYRLAFLLDPTILEKRGSFGVILQTQSAEDMAQFHFILAKSFATIGDVERCLFYLRRALEEGFRDVALLRTAPEFALVREDVRFQQLLAERPPALQP